MSDTECPTCGDEFKSKLGVQQHHARTHGERLTVTVECDWCGKEKEVYPRSAKRNKHHFCEGEDSNCLGDWVSENKSGRDHPRWDRIEVGCDWCGEKKYVNRYVAEHNDHHFCEGEDSNCFGEWVSETHTGEGHPRWVDDPVNTDYGPTWTVELREYIRETQNRQCADCGVVDTFLPRKLDVHHINPDQWMNGWKINQHWNLVALCRVCHGYWEGEREAKQRMEFGKHAMRAGEPDDDEPFVGFDREAAEASGWLVDD